MAPSELTDFQRAVLDVLQTTQPGDVLSYGDVAAESGHPGAARAVGNALRQIGQTTDQGDPAFPWWRVVTASGRLIPHNPELQASLLKGEGVTLPLQPDR